MVAVLERISLSLQASGLRKALGVLKMCSAVRSSVTILQNVLFSYEEGSAFATTCDGETWAKAHLGSSEPFESFALPVRVLSDLVALIDADASLSFTPIPGRSSIAVEAPRLRVQMLGADPTDFPVPLAVPHEATLVVPGAEYTADFLRAARCCSTDSHRQVLTGVLHEVTNSSLRLIATDTHRLMVLKSKGVGDACSVVVPMRIASILATLAPTGDVEITFGGGRLSFRVGGVQIVAQVLAGTYPNWERVLPAETTTPVYTLDPASLAKSVRRCLVLAKHNANRVRFRFHDEGLSVAGRSEEIGEYFETVSWLTRAVKNARDSHEMEIAFNGRYVLDAIAACGPKPIAEGTEPIRPFIFRSEGGEVTVCIMPMALA